MGILNPGGSILSQRHKLIAEVGCYIPGGRLIAPGVAESLPFEDELYDTANIHDNVINNTRFYLPPAARFARMFISTDTNKIGAGTSHIVGRYTFISIPFYQPLRGMAVWEDTTSTGNISKASSMMSPLFPVGVFAVGVDGVGAGSAGDYMEIRAANLTGTGYLIVGFATSSLFGFEFYD